MCFFLLVFEWLVIKNGCSLLDQGILKLALSQESFDGMSWFFACFSFFFNYLAVPRPTLCHSQGDSLTNLMLITVFVHNQPEGHQEPHNKVGFLSPAEGLAGLGKLKVNLVILGCVYAQKWVRAFRSYETLKSGASHKWFDESSGLIKWFSVSLKFAGCPLKLYFLRMMFCF